MSSHSNRIRAVLSFILAGFAVCGWTTTAVAQAPGSALGNQLLTEGGDEETRAIDNLFATVGWRTDMTALTVDESYDQTYDPYVAMMWRVAPMYIIKPWFNVSAQLSWGTELTNSNFTTKQNQTLFNDIQLRAAFPAFATIPGADINVTGDLILRLPTSRMSRNNSLVMGIGPGLTLARNFSFLGGASLGYGVRFTGLPHRFSSPSPRELDCNGSSAICGVEVDTQLPGVLTGGTANTGIAEVNVGSRNPRYTLSHTIQGSISPVQGLWVFAGWTHVTTWLYPPAEVDEEQFDGILGATEDPSLDQTIDDQNRRWTHIYSLGTSYSPIQWLTLSLGATTAGNPRRPNNSTRTAVFNRNTTLYFDAAIDFARFL